MSKATVEAQQETSRASRSATVRETETRSRKPWTPPQMLDVPHPQDGFKYRWLRAEMLGEQDKTNMGNRLREGYEPVRPAELEGFDHLPTIDDGRHAGVIGVGGLILGKIPEETAQERRAYYNQQTRNQMYGIDSSLADVSTPVMPMGAPDRKRTTSFGNPENNGINNSDDQLLISPCLVLLVCFMFRRN